MTGQPAAEEHKLRRRLVHNWEEEERALAAIGTKETRTKIQKYGHKGILTVDEDSKMEVVSTARAVYTPPKDPGVRLQGIRRQLLEKQLAETISEKIQSERNLPIPKTDYTSTTQNDFYIEGYVPFKPQTTKVHDYKTDQAVTFWSENYQMIQGVTPVKTLNAPFRKSALFSTPISERLDEIDLPPDD